jgi:hypothetical protein
MKTITNKTTEIVFSEQDLTKMTYFDLIKLIVNQPTPGGFDVEQMRQRLNLWGIFDTALLNKADTVELALKDFPAVKELVSNFRWKVAHKDAIDFVDYINSL